MDPEEAYRELCAAIDALRSGEVTIRLGELSPLDRVADAWDALDGWLTRGGFLPGPWRKWREDARASGEAAGFMQGRQLIIDRARVIDVTLPADALPDANERARQRGLGI
jgi:hypothetical protein